MKPFAQMIFVLVVSGVIGFPLCLLLLRLYKRAVIRSMQHRAVAGTESLIPWPELAAAHSTTPRANSAGRQRMAARGPWTTTGIYVVAGSAYALVMTFAFLYGSRIALSPGRFLVLFCDYAWPVVLAIALVAPIDWVKKIIVFSSYFVLLGLSRVLDLRWNEIVVVWAVINLVPSILLWPFLNRRIRAVGPLVFTFVVLGFGGCNLAVALLAYDVNQGGTLTKGALALGCTAITLPVAIILAGLLAFGPLGWLSMKWLGWRYQRKKISDQSIVLDSIWVVFALSHSVYLVANGWIWALGGIAAFSLYKLVLALGFRLTMPGPEDGRTTPRLLILRVFFLGRRSERMFDAIAKRWRYAGSIQLIAGPDLATSTVEPHEFLAFLGGKVSRSFIDGPATFAARLAALDLTRDFDGRFRVTDFFCHADTWQMVLSRLVSESDTILMDLRGFSRANAGCVFELRELKKLANPKRAVLVIDQTTDEAFLNETVQGAGFEFFRSNGHRRELPQLMGALCVAAT